MSSIYLIGSLRNEEVPIIANTLRNAGHDVFDDWYAAGPEADDKWRDYERSKGHNYQEALDGYAAEHVFQFDKFHLDRCAVGILVYPAGKSAHLELGYMIGQGKKGYILMDGEPERYDVMTKFANKVCISIDELVKELRQNQGFGLYPLPTVDHDAKICRSCDSYGTAFNCIHCKELAGAS